LSYVLIIFFRENKMERTGVSSSNLHSVGYDSNTRILEVGFLTGSVYQYSGVPESIYQGLMSAGSHGRYLANYIKGRYSYRRV
jgi:hypothetical protein